MASLSSLDPRLLPAARWFVAELRRIGLSPVVTSARRSRAEQARLYERYKRGQSKFPAARPGYSLHEHGLAFDVMTSDPPRAGAIWRELGGDWSPGDAVHFAARVVR